jgi:hypothetical protein
MALGDNKKLQKIYPLIPHPKILQSVKAIKNDLKLKTTSGQLLQSIM